MKPVNAISAGLASTSDTLSQHAWVPVSVASAPEGIPTAWLQGVLGELIEAFLSQLDRSPGTVSAYRQGLMNFREWFSGQSSPLTDKRSILAYKRDLLKERMSARIETAQGVISMAIYCEGPAEESAVLFSRGESLPALRLQRANQAGFERYAKNLAKEFAGKLTLRRLRYSDMSVNIHLGALKALLSWAAEKQIAPVDIGRSVARVKLERRYRRPPMAPQDFLELLGRVGEGDGPVAVRNAALFWALGGLALRVSEAARANRGDLGFQGRDRVLFVQGKGQVSKNRWVSVSDEVGKALDRWLEVSAPFGFADHDPLFPCLSPRNRNGRLTARSISRLFRDAAMEAGVLRPQVTAHSLRHMHACLLYHTAKVPLELVQDRLRHINAESTKLYARVDHVSAGTADAFSRALADFR